MPLGIVALERDRAMGRTKRKDGGASRAAHRKGSGKEGAPWAQTPPPQPCGTKASA
jgi:hypothetical protein